MQRPDIQHNHSARDTTLIQQLYERNLLVNSNKPQQILIGLFISSFIRLIYLTHIVSQTDSETFSLQALHDTAGQLLCTAFNYLFVPRKGPTREMKSVDTGYGDYMYWSMVAMCTGLWWLCLLVYGGYMYWSMVAMFAGLWWLCLLVYGGYVCWSMVAMWAGLW